MAEDISKISWPGWETVCLIGRGSFGAVYEIQRSIPGALETAALKVISIPQDPNDLDDMYSDGYDDESITSTFQSHLKSIIAEYSMMKKMSDCVNIVKCEDVRYVQHDDGIGWDIFIKMEKLTPLIKALPAEIPESMVIRLAEDICNALDMCSKYNIIHRDIKPQNIFVSEHGDYKLGDFGIAKTVEKTMGGTKIGTYKYMAPEVYNNQPYGCAADIYSLGLVCYWLLNERRLPFLPLPPAKLKAGLDEEARQRRLSGKEPIPAPAHGSANLKRIVLKACAYSPADRYKSAAEMLSDLKASQQPFPTKDPIPDPPKDPIPDPPKDPIPDPQKKKKWPVFAAVAGLGAAVIVGGLLYPNGLSVETPSPDVTLDISAEKELEWSEWMDELPTAVLVSDNYEVEEETLYRSREKETTTSSEANMDGWEQYDASVSKGEYGGWSNWSETPVSASDTRQVETKIQYSYRTQNISQEYTEWGDWSSWQDGSASGNDTKDVQTRTVYSYYWYECPNCGAHMHGYGFTCPTWAGGCGQALISNQYHVVWGTTPQSEMRFQDWHGTGYTYAYYDGNLVFRNINTPNESKTQYRYRTRSLKDVVYYSDWSSYSDTPVQSSSTREVRTRTVYRYRDCSLEYTYYYSRWGEWSPWGTDPVFETSTREIETREVWRYAEKE